jgi:hypothetical protein
LRKKSVISDCGFLEKRRSRSDAGVLRQGILLASIDHRQYDKSQEGGIDGIWHHLGHKELENQFRASQCKVIETQRTANGPTDWLEAGVK